MHAIISLLDDVHTLEVEHVWSDLRERFGLAGIYRTPFPHFSYQIAEAYDFDRLTDALRALARRTPALTVSTCGLGIFTANEPVVYVPVVRAGALDRVHRAVWSSVRDAVTGASPHYEPDHWMPHITLAQWNLDRDTLAAVIAHLHERNFYWTVQVHNFAVIEDLGDRQVVRDRFALR